MDNDYLFAQMKSLYKIVNDIETVTYGQEPYKWTNETI